MIYPIDIYQENEARSVANDSDEYLKRQWGMREIDNSHFLRCPRCGKLPTVLLGKRGGRVKCCGLAVVIIEATSGRNLLYMDEKPKPVTDGALAFRWSKVVYADKASFISENKDYSNK